MSTNPFRRSSLKEPSGSTSYPSDWAVDAGSVDQDDPGTTALTIKTRAPSSTQKHVNFASPPAVPISPVSYPPSSPESIRISPAFSIAQPALPAPTDYSEAIQSDPFQAEAETDEDDGAIEQALHNARVNTEVTAFDPNKEKEDAVKKTLSKFASTPRKAGVALMNATASTRTAPSTHRQTMDVDAFKRLLLTGDSGQGGQPAEPASSTAVVTPQSFGRTFSTVPSTSVFAPQSATYPSDEALPSLVTGSGPRRSSDQTPSAVGEAEGGKPKPPPPKSRHGKLIADPLVPTPPARPQAERVDIAVDRHSVSREAEAAGAPKRAPPPPLSRRKSHNSGTVRADSSRRSSVSDRESTDGRADHVPKVPPPPPSRRPNATLDRRPSSDLPPTAEESDASDESSPAAPPSVPVKSAPTIAKSSYLLKRPSMGPGNPPPLPPPRRGRESSRSSIDSQRPTLSTLSGAFGSTRSSGEYARPEDESRPAPSAGTGSDILASLAALQQELDEARRSIT